MLKVRGSMVFPSQIEDCIASLNATVNEAWRVCIDREERILEEIVVAVERRHDAVMDADAVRKALRAQSARVSAFGSTSRPIPKAFCRGSKRRPCAYPRK